MADESGDVAVIDAVIDGDVALLDHDRARREDEESLQEVRSELQRNLKSSSSNITGVQIPDIDNTEYVEPVPDPYKKAISYLEQHNIIQLFQNMTSNIVYQRPEQPIDFLIAEVEGLMKTRSESDDETTKET